MNNLKVALIQHKAVPNEIEKNLELGLRYVKEAKSKGADLVLFPEMWSNGYEPPFPEAFDAPFNEQFDRERKLWLAQAVDEDSHYVKSFQEAAKELVIGIVITYLAKGVTAPQNTAVVIDKTGEILMSYSKVHTCDFSLEALLESGTAFNVCEFNRVKIGLMICYDREFPESARVLMLKGAEIILVPNACDMNPARLQQLSTRAFENMVGVAMANYPAPKWGQSCAYSPIVFANEGYVENELIKATDELEDIIIVEFNMDLIRDYRQCETWGNAYRKVATYHDIVNQTVKAPFIRQSIKPNQ